MLKKSYLFLFIFTAALLCACAALDNKSGKAVSEDAYNNFTIGTTKKSDVSSLLGEPQKVRSEDGNTIYVYSLDTITAMPFAPNRNQTVVLTFDSQGVLTNKNRTQSNTTLGNPLTGQ